MQESPSKPLGELVSDLEAAAEEGYYNTLVAKFATMPAGAERCYAMAKVLKTGANIKKFEDAYVRQQGKPDNSDSHVRDVMYTMLMYMVGVEQP